MDGVSLEDDDVHVAESPGASASSVGLSVACCCKRRPSGDVISLADIEPGPVNAGWNRSRIYSHHKLAVFHGGLGLGSCCNFP